MRLKNLMVFSLVTVCVLFLAAAVSAATEITTNVAIEVNGMDVTVNPAIVAGETATVVVDFTSEENVTNVRIEAEIEGEKVDVDDRTDVFDVEENNHYKKILRLDIPYELKDQLSDDVLLNVKIWSGSLYRTEVENIVLRVQRPSYNANVMSVSIPQAVEAGEKLPVDIVLKNRGYNSLDDLYVTVKVPELGLERTSYFGDLVNLENDDDEDTVSGRIYLDVPYDVKAGDYTLEVEVDNDDTSSTAKKTLSVENDLSKFVLVPSSQKTVAVGEDAEYELLLINPTNKLKVYSVVAESSGKVQAGASQSVVAVPAGSSKTVIVVANAAEEGVFNFNVDVLSGETLVDTVNLGLSAKAVEENTVASPIVVLTVILAIIFLVLLVVLIVLLGKKPNQTEEFGESYY